MLCSYLFLQLGAHFRANPRFLVLCIGTNIIELYIGHWNNTYFQGVLYEK